MDCTTQDFRVLQCMVKTDYGKKYISWNFTLFTPTLNVTKAIFHFCTCAKRCCVLWLPPRASSLTGDACERLHVPTHTKIKSKEFSSYRCWCSCSSWWWHSPANGCAQLTALAPTPSLHFRWLVKSCCPEQCGTQQVLHQQSLQSSSHTCYSCPCSHSAEETGKKDRPSILFKTFKKLIDKNW